VTEENTRVNLKTIKSKDTVSLSGRIAVNLKVIGSMESSMESDISRIQEASLKRASGIMERDRSG
jgi:hypothetical protein